MFLVVLTASELSNEEMIGEKYRGIRPAPGYPACPDHTEKAALFDLLGPKLAGARFLDLYAGSGAVGLEAWSRGAGVVTLVEQDRRTAGLIGENARTIGFPRADVVAATVGGTLRRAPAAPYDVVFLDPPYPLPDAAVTDDLGALAAHDWLVPGALVVVERSTRSPEPGWPPGFTDVRHKRYGETALWYGHASQPAERPEPATPTPAQE